MESSDKKVNSWTRPWSKGLIQYFVWKEPNLGLFYEGGQVPAGSDVWRLN